MPWSEQTWVDNNENAGGTKIKDGMINLENKTNTLQTNWCGTSFPDSAISQVGQLCWRRDLGKLYQLTAKGGSDTWTQIAVGVVPVALGGTGATDAAGARTALGLGTVAVESTVPLTKGGTGGTTAAAARTNLGLGSVATESTIPITKGGTGATTAGGARGALGLGSLAVKNTVAQADIDTAAVDITRMKSSATTGVLFGTNAGSTATVEIPRDGIFRKFDGRPVKFLQSGCRQPNAVAVVTLDGALWILGFCQHAAPDFGNGRSHTTSFRPVIFESDPGTITKVVLSRTSGYVLTSAGKVWSWGNNSYGQLGHGDTTARKVAKKIVALDSLNITDVVAATTAFGTLYDSIWFVTSTGTVYGCGSNAHGQLGDSSTTQRNSPVQCGAISGITQLSIGDCGSTPHVIALKSDGTIYTWGACHQGQLGQGNTTQLAAPTVVSGQTGIDFVKAMGSTNSSTTFIADGNVLKACGHNMWGGLGDASTTQRNSFVTVTLPGSPGNVAEISGTAGWGFTLVRDVLGTLYVTGRNGKGQLGQGNTTDRNTFTAISFAGGVTATKLAATNVDSDCGTSIVLGSDGNLYACGNNNDGILGQGDNTDRSSFVRLLRPQDSDPIVDFRVVASSTALAFDRSGILALTSSGQLLGCGHLAGCGLGFPPVHGDSSPREERVLTPIPVTM